MALFNQASSSFSLFSFMGLIFLLNVCSAFNPKQFNSSMIDSGWSSAGATWYGASNGDGSEGGACGYASAVGEPPFSSMISAGGPSLFKAGKGCGACYEVKCVSNPSCSKKPVTVTITDECPGCPDSVHFDLSGTAFGKMAIEGKEDQLRNVGQMQIQYQRVNCNYPGVNLAFRVDTGSNPYFFAIAIEYEDGDGDIGGVDLQDSSGVWYPMQQLWGVIWKLNSGSMLQAPYSIRLKAGESGKTIVANAVIPVGWQPGMTYRSFVKFNKNHTNLN